MHSPHSAERLSTELQSALVPRLAPKGYELVAFGPAGLTWKRSPSRGRWAAIIILGLLALGSFGSAGDSGGSVAGSIIGGLACAAIAAVLFWLRRPSTISVGLRPSHAGGTDITVAAVSDAELTETIVAGYAGSG